MTHAAGPCPTCAAPLPRGVSTCPSCGRSPAFATTPESALETSPAPAVPRRSAPASAADGRSSTGGGFTPGQVLAGRYRILGLLGRGGMGEVYRADDLKLGEPVALKFLPRALEADPAALRRLHEEVRSARQVSHPHVCRVHDIDEADGRHFLTMEYVDGEDLATLLRRIGRLPESKALEIARQVCAGLQAVHDRGVVHRDLKPANVMLDGHGRARITDFGLAVSGGQSAGEVAGTPAYMAPEQLAGAPVTARTDLYALGLLLYELCTGRRPFEAASLAEWKRVHAEEPPTSPSRHARELDPAFERVILRCLEKDPARRPSSAAAVAAALPGGDPLAAAIAAGQTPSPEMVAAASATGALRPGTALACLAGVVAVLAALSFGSRCNLYRQVPFEKSPEVLADRAAVLISEAGLPARPADRAWGFGMDPRWMAMNADPLPAPARWRRISSGQPLTYFFWYRQSPRPLSPGSFEGNRGQVTLDDPPASFEGMASVVLDPRGRLVELRIVPFATTEGTPARLETDWSRLFAAAGLDPSRLAPAEPAWTPPFHADRTVAWTGTFADHQDLPLRVEAASLRGRPVSFRVVAPWDDPPMRDTSQLETAQLAAGIVAVVLFGTIFTVAVLLARRNLRLGRGDLGGALRLAAFAAALTILAAFLRSDLPLTLGGVVGSVLVLTKVGLLSAGGIWVLYVALEPQVRRHDPHLLISWSRLLAGHLRDPLIGRDVLVGTLLGLGGTAANYLGGWLKVWTGHPLAPNHYLRAETLDGLPPALAVALEQAFLSLWVTLAILVFLVRARKLVRRDWAAALLLLAAFSSIEILFAARSWPAVIAMVLRWVLVIGIVARLGLVAGVAGNLAGFVTLSFPLTSDLSAPYAGQALLGVLAVLALAVYGFWVCRGSGGSTGALADDD